MISDIDLDMPHPQTIIHVDIDCFYAQVEMILNPKIKDLPIGIRQKNLLVTCNYKAREMGLRKYMALSEAIKLIPNLIVIDGSDLSNYRKFSNDVFEILQKYTNLVEKLGMDENFIDVSHIIDLHSESASFNVFGTNEPSSFSDLCGCGCHERIKSGAVLASIMRDDIFKLTGLTCCAGIAHNKLIAKLISSQNKPNNQTVAFPWQSLDVIDSLKSLTDIPGIGTITYKTLKRLGINTIIELQQASVTFMSTHFSPNTAKLIIGLANGEDLSVVKPSGPPNIIGVEDAFLKVDSISGIQQKINQLSTRLIKLLEEDNRLPNSIKITIRRVTFKNRTTRSKETKQAQLSAKFNSLSTIEKKVEFISKESLKILEYMIPLKKEFHLTLLGISFIKLEKKRDQKESIARFVKKFKSNPSPSKNNELIQAESSGVIKNKEIYLKDINAMFSSQINLGETSQEPVHNNLLTEDIEFDSFDDLPTPKKRIILEDYELITKDYKRMGKYSGKPKQTKLTDFFSKN